MTKKIGILNSGGDCPGLNAVIASVVKFGSSLGYEFLGFEKGWEGILNPPMYQELNVESVKGISYQGGTILRTANKGRFAGKVGSGQHNKIPDKILKEAKSNLENLGVEGLIVIGGDGTLSAALQLAEYGVNIVGVPKTIDNDLSSTDKTFGFSTAVGVVVDALDRIHTTAASHERTFIVECMGRGAGWIALSAGLAGGANAILMPEFDFTVDGLIGHMRYRQKTQSRSTIILIAEGAKVEDKYSHINTGGGHEIRYVGVSDVLMNEIESRVPGEFEMRNVILGHTQRGGTPNPEDRTLAKRYGVAAMEAYHQKKFGSMVCLEDNVMTTCSIADATHDIKRVSDEAYEYHVARQLGIFMHE